MDKDTYVNNLDIVAEKLLSDSNCGEVCASSLGMYMLDSEAIAVIMEMVDYKKEIITQSEINRADLNNNPMIDLLDMEDKTKIIMNAIYNDIYDKACKKEFLQSMEKYRIGQPIFTGNDLYKHVRDCNELIDYEKLTWEKAANVCSYGNKYYIVNSYIKEELLDFIHNECKGKKKYIRINPYFCSEEFPIPYFIHEALRPVNPKWISRLKLYKGQSDGGHYFLQKPLEINSDEDRRKDIEYSFWGIRSLEIFVKRRYDGNLSMMVEEVTARLVHGEYYVAKCIHLDTDDDVGTNIDDVILNHIDLAINVYGFDAYEMRKEMSLSKGKVENASLRIHLLRLENVTFKALINLSYLFFDSEILTKEWISAQFG